MATANRDFGDKMNNGRGRQEGAMGRRPDGEQGKIRSFDARQQTQFNPKGQKIFDGYAPGQAFKSKPGSRASRRDSTGRPAGPGRDRGAADSEGGPRHGQGVLQEPRRAKRRAGEGSVRRTAETLSQKPFDGYAASPSLARAARRPRPSLRSNCGVTICGVGCRFISRADNNAVAHIRHEGHFPMANSFGSQSTLKVGDRSYTIHRLDAVYKTLPDAARLPYSLKILLENLLRTENGLSVMRRRHRSARQVGPDRRPEPGNRVHAEPGAAARLHRRAVRRRPRRHARRPRPASAATRSASTRCSRSNWSSTTRCRWTTSAPSSRS